MPASMRAECVLQCRDALGEVPLWDAEGARIWWIDVREPSLQAAPRHGRAPQIRAADAVGW